MTTSSIYDEDFCKNSQRILIVNYFCKNILKIWCFNFREQMSPQYSESYRYAISSGVVEFMRTTAQC